MFFTIAIQTYNHAGGLGEALRSLVELRCPEGGDYEILVVDNNSTDGTRGVIEELGGVLGPRLRGLFEPRQGLSHARNRAIAEARGEVVCFLDDDAVADPDWLAGHAAVYRSDEYVAAVGGRIELRWPRDRSRPRWLGPELEGYLSGLDLGPKRMVMEYPNYPYGCNMSVRRDVARQVGGFSTALGRQGRRLRSNEEKLFFHKVRRQGGRIIYTPGAVVRHVIPAERLSRRFFLKRAYAQGVSDIIFRREVAEEEGKKVIREEGETLPVGSSAAARLPSGIRTFLGGCGRLAGVCLHASIDIVRHRNSATCFLGLARGAYAAGYVAGAASKAHNARQES